MLRGRGRSARGGLRRRRWSKKGDLADDAVVCLALIDGFDCVIDVYAGIEKAEVGAEGYLSQDIECEEMQPLAEITLFPAIGELVHFADE